jgi:DNA-binding MarR family transcriptional regulator
MIINADFRLALDRAIGEDGLSTRVFSVLTLIVNEPGITQSDVARRLGIERSGLVAIIDELQLRGYAERVPVAGDRRVQALRPTQQGQAAHAAAAEAVVAHERDLLSILSEDERAQLSAILAKIRDAYEGED